MPKFSSSTIGGRIEYDFREWGGPEGVVPEPPRMAVKKFMSGVQKIFKDLGLKEDSESSDENEEELISPNELVNTMNDIDDEEIFERLTEGITGEMAILCGATRMEKETGEKNEQGFPVVEFEYSGGSPSYDVLKALHYRPFMGFFGYLMEHLMNPEVSRSDTTQSPRRLRSV